MIQKKKSTWHKNKTAPKKTADKMNKKTNVGAQHWVVSSARLVQIMESAGITPENNIKMLPRSRDR